MTPDERKRRWRLVLGGEGDTGQPLAGDDVRIDAALAALYDAPAPTAEGGPPTGERGASLAASAPRVARWLGDIRRYFPSTVVRVMQADAIERLNLTRLLLEPEMLEAVEPDIHLVGTLLSLRGVMPEQTRQAAGGGGGQGRGRHRAAHRRTGPGRRRRRAQPGRPDRAAPPPRHRLEPHGAGEPAPLPARSSARSCRSG